MKKLETVMEENQLIDSKGWRYYGLEMQPCYRLAQIMDFIYETELDEPLPEWEDCLKLAMFVGDKVWVGETLDADRLNELHREMEEAYQGEYASEAEFAEDFMFATGVFDTDALKDLVIDWQATYTYSLQHDYFNTYVYCRNEEENDVDVKRYFWRAD